MNGWTSRDEPDLCAEPVWVKCEACGIAIQADPIDLAYETEDEAEYVCLACTREQQRAKRDVA